MNIALGDDGDWLIVDGELQLITGVEEIAQFSAQKLKTILGEWFLDVRIGLPLFSKILVKKFEVPVVEQILINEIISTPGIIRLEEFNLTLNKATRQLAVEYRAQSTEGEINFNEVIG